METVMKVRHLVLTKKLSQREVSRRTGISRNTISKYIKVDLLRKSGEVFLS